MPVPGLATLGWWHPTGAAPTYAPASLADAARRFRETTYVVREGEDGRVGVAFSGRLADAPTDTPLLAVLPPLYPEWLGDRSFQEVHGTRFGYIAGAMANGIATTRLVITMARAGMLGFFGAAGLSRGRVEASIDELQQALGDALPWGANLIHSPSEPELERSVADLYVAKGVRRVSASAYMALTPHIVAYAFHGVREVDGAVVRRNYVFCKISRPEVARRFLTPPPQEMLDGLVREGRLTASEAALAARLPVAEDVIVEADSGGHTDNQTLTALFPTILRLRDQLVAEHGYARPIRVGAAGGLGTPSAVAAAFGLGAAFVLTGSVNQACVESGLSEEGRVLLAQAGLADVMMAPAADMFELGVKVQVLKRGTMFGPRALKLYETYTRHEGFHTLSDDERATLEKRVLGRPLDDIWADTRAFWAEREPRELAKAERDPKHQMALCFRWYLGLSSRWAIGGEPGRKMDFQIWSGPAMGAFNAWVEGSFLQPPEARQAVQVALNLLEGAATITRAQQLRVSGVAMPDAAFHFPPRPLSVAAPRT